MDGGLQTSDLLNSRHISSLKKDAVTKMFFLFVFSTKGGEMKQKKKKLNLLNETLSRHFNDIKYNSLVTAAYVSLNNSLTIYLSLESESSRPVILQ